MAYDIAWSGPAGHLGIDAAPVLITLNQAPGANPATVTAPVVAGTPAEPKAAVVPVSAGQVTPVVSAENVPASTPAPADLRDAQRLSFNEPMYIMFGAHDGANAKFQLSFKFRIYEGKDPASKRFIDNLYFAYTQFSLWDLPAPRSRSRTPTTGRACITTCPTRA
jgi:hypothetical protein